MAFKAGSFYFPGGSIDVGMEPQAVLFFGGNQSVEDTVVTGGTPAVFFGMMWRTIAGGTDQQCISNGHPGVRWQQKAITCISTPGGVDMEATGAFTSTGFTISADVSPGGARLIHYLAIGELDDCVGHNFGQTGGSIDIALGFRPLSTLMMSMFAGGNAQTGNNDDANYFSMGCANWPDFDDADDVDDFNNNGGALTFYVSNNDQSSCNIFTNHSNISIAPNIFPAVTAGFYNDGYDNMFPVPTFLGTTARIQLDSAHRSSPLFLDCNGFVRRVICPDASTTIAYSTPDYMDNIEAALFFGPGGHDHLVTSGGGACAYMYGVLTEDYQGCVAYDRHQDSDNVGHFYQSSQRCDANSMFGSGTIRTASGEIVGDEVHLTGEEVTEALNSSVIMQVWGEVDNPSMYMMEV